MFVITDPFERSARLFGAEAMQKLWSARVAVFGVGGVGGHCAEALARSGIGAIDLYDNDVVSLSNINRQIIALHSTLGRYKADVMAERVLDINPECEVRAFRLFYMPETANEVDLSIYSYVADAIDTVAGKTELIARAEAAGIPVICAMGAGNKLDPAAFAVMDIYKTETDPLARALRKELRARGVAGAKVVCSREAPVRREGGIPETDAVSQEAGEGRGRAPASNAFVPPVCGLIMAGEIVKDLIRA